MRSYYCIYCGNRAPQDGAFCPECGHEFSNIKANQSVQRLSEQLAAIMSKTIDVSHIKAEDRDNHLKNERANLMSSCIQRFPIPTSKEDLLEFITYAVPQATVKASFGDGEDVDVLKKAWKAKAKEAILKAKLVLQNDPNSLVIVEEYEKRLNKFRLSGFAKTMLYAAIIVIILWTILGVFA